MIHSVNPVCGVTTLLSSLVVTFAFRQTSSVSQLPFIYSFIWRWIINKFIYAGASSFRKWIFYFLIRSRLSVSFMENESQRSHDYAGGYSHTVFTLQIYSDLIVKFQPFIVSQWQIITKCISTVTGCLMRDAKSLFPFQCLVWFLA